MSYEKLEIDGANIDKTKIAMLDDDLLIEENSGEKSKIKIEKEGEVKVELGGGTMTIERREKEGEGKEKIMSIQNSEINPGSSVIIGDNNEVISDGEGTIIKTSKEEYHFKPGEDPGNFNIINGKVEFEEERDYSKYRVERVKDKEGERDKGNGETDNLQNKNVIKNSSIKGRISVGDGNKLEINGVVAGGNNKEGRGKNEGIDDGEEDKWDKKFDKEFDKKFDVFDDVKEGGDIEDKEGESDNDNTGNNNIISGKTINTQNFQIGKGNTQIIDGVVVEGDLVKDGGNLAEKEVSNVFDGNEDKKIENNVGVERVVKKEGNDVEVGNSLEVVKEEDDDVKKRQEESIEKEKRQGGGVEKEKKEGENSIGESVKIKEEESQREKAQQQEQEKINFDELERIERQIEEGLSSINNYEKTDNRGSEETTQKNTEGFKGDRGDSSNKKETENEKTQEQRIFEIKNELLKFIEGIKEELKRREEKALEGLEKKNKELVEREGNLDKREKEIKRREKEVEGRGFEASSMEKQKEGGEYKDEVLENLLDDWGIDRLAPIQFKTLGKEVNNLEKYVEKKRERNIFSKTIDYFKDKKYKKELKRENQSKKEMLGVNFDFSKYGIDNMDAKGLGESLFFAAHRKIRENMLASYGDAGDKNYMEAERMISKLAEEDIVSKSLEAVEHFKLFCDLAFEKFSKNEAGGSINGLNAKLIKIFEETLNKSFELGKLEENKEGDTEYYKKEFSQFFKEKLNV